MTILYRNGMFLFFALQMACNSSADANRDTQDFIKFGSYFLALEEQSTTVFEDDTVMKVSIANMAEPENDKQTAIVPGSYERLNAILRRQLVSRPQNPDGHDSQGGSNYISFRQNGIETYIAYPFEVDDGDDVAIVDWLT